MEKRKEKDFLKLVIDSINVQVPYKQFNQSEIAYHIFYKNEEGVAINVLILRPHHNHKDKYLIVGFDFFNEKIVPIYSNQVELLLNALQRYLNLFLEEDGLLVEIDKAKDNIRETNVEKASEPYLSLTDKLSVFMGNKNIDIPIEKVRVNLTKDYSIIPSSFLCINSHSDLDYIEINFDIDKLNYNKLKSKHLLDMVDIKLKNNKNIWERKLSCFNIVKIDQSLKMTLVNPALLSLTQKKVNIKIQNIDIREIVYFLGRNSGFPSNKIQIKSNTEQSVKNYELCIPIKYIKAKSSFGIGDTFFYPPEYDSKEIYEIKERMQKENINNYSWAKIYIEDTNAYDAYLKGKEKIKKALDLLLFILRVDTVFLNYSLSEEINVWERSDLTPKPKLSSWISIKNIYSNGLMIINTEQISEPLSLNINEDKMRKVKICEQLQYLLNDMHDNDDKKIKLLFKALDWIKRSWNAESIEDQILFSINSLEFTIAQEKPPKLISNKSIRTEMVEKALNHFKDDCGEYNEELEDKIKSRLHNALTSSSFHKKLDYLIKRLEIPVEEKDCELISKVRKVRNGIAHGRSYKKLTRREIVKCNEIINMIIAYKLNNFKEERN